MIVPCEANEACTDLVCEGVQGQEYTGTAEEGVVCDATTCASPASVCCVTLMSALVATCVAPGDTCAGGIINVPVVCDGPEDCEAAQECCLDGATFATSCVSAGSCVATGQSSSVVCVSTEDCGVEELCCAASNLMLPVELGTCSPAANQCSSG